MQNLLLSRAVVACPIGMGLVWMMVRGRPLGGADCPVDASAQQELTRLRAEVEQLRTGRAHRISQHG